NQQLAVTFDGLFLRNRMKFVNVVCGADQTAHQKGNIQRDIGIQHVMEGVEKSLNMLRSRIKNEGRNKISQLAKGFVFLHNGGQRWMFSKENFDQQWVHIHTHEKIGNNAKAQNAEEKKQLDD